MIATPRDTSIKTLQKGNDHCNTPYSSSSWQFPFLCSVWIVLRRESFFFQGNKKQNVLTAFCLGVWLSCSMLQKLCQLMAPFRNVSNRFRFMLDLPTSRAQIFSRARTVSDRLFMFSASKVSERAKLDLFPLQKIALKNFVLRVLKTKQVGNVFSLCGCQENPTLVKYPNGGRQNAH